MSKVDRRGTARSGAGEDEGGDSDNSGESADDRRDSGRRAEPQYVGLSGLPNLGNTCPQHITFRIAQKAGIAFRLNKYDCEFYSEAN